MATTTEVQVATTRDDLLAEFNAVMYERMQFELRKQRAIFRKNPELVEVAHLLQVLELGLKVWREEPQQLLGEETATA